MSADGTRKPPNVFDVARVSGVSTATVSRVFTGKTNRVAPETVERVTAAAKSLGYTPSEIGRSLRLATTKVVVLLVPDATNDFCADVAISLEQSLKGIGLSMVLANTGEDPERQDQLLDDAEGLRPHAIILLGAMDTPRLRQAAQSKRAIIFVNRRPPPTIKGPFVGIDNEAAGYAVAEHFIRQGFSDCAIIHGPRRYSASRGRLEGFLRCLSERGIDTGSVRQIESALTMEAGYKHGLALLRADHPPRAVFCGNDMIAYGINRAATETGARVPEDVAICGFDDNRVNDWLAPWLTTVRVPALDFGPAVISLLNDQEAMPKTSEVILPFSMTIRKSA
ncbi:LacI family DNA-binding transcriptional regulator [Labrys wisconsinensis]|uniref:LacI family transcriptional regulator n=1 Tax=Labrys wisconsinensis TaxID=425677 RepID=A0ABU0J4R5_9HYPH|nr:LacI family DNA-binding transcriptional regulator [Labrys wisconsinensis]MDQ0469257.1 LacI family transcriptional regulator [Labrys wisconsinensis]